MSGRKKFSNGGTSNPRQTRSACSGKRHHRRSRSLHEWPPEAQTTGATDTKAPEARSRGRPQTKLYNAARPHAPLGYKPPAPEFFVPALAAGPSLFGQLKSSAFRLLSPISDIPVGLHFRGFLGVHSHCGLHTRTVSVFRDRWASDISSPPCLRPGCFWLERLPGAPCTHWKMPPFHGARGKRSVHHKLSLMSTRR